MLYTAEPIYFYMIGKNARHNQVLISRNDHFYWLIPDYGMHFYQSYKSK